MKNFYKVITIAILMVSFGFATFGYADFYSSYNEVKIGILYGQSCPAQVKLSASNDIEMGYFVGHEFNIIMDFFEKEVIVKKDPQNSIYIQIGQDFLSNNEAYTFLSQISSSVHNSFIAYKNGVKVWAGPYENFTDAQASLENIKSILPEYNMMIVSSLGKGIQVVNQSGKILFVYDSLDGEYHFRESLHKDASGIIQVDHKKYRGSIMIKRYSNSDFTVINQLGLEEYLYGVLPKEISGDWPIEAQKAQAVAARSYTLVNMNKHKAYGFDLCSSTDCQVYGGYSSEKPRSNEAVDQTRGKIMTYEGKAVTALYHSNSGGHTEDSENIWSNPIGYLRGVDDPYSIGAPNSEWTVVYTKKQIEDILMAKNIYVGNIQSINIIERSKNGRVLKLSIQGTNGEKILQKDEIRSVFGYNNIKSTWFDMIGNNSNNGNGLREENSGQLFINSDKDFLSKSIEDSSLYLISSEKIKKANENIYVSNGEKTKSLSQPIFNHSSDSYTFSGKGWGHGLGMSQWGAKKMAEQGFSYEQILKHYYTGIHIE
ncbi:SpoIID/LytB domain-containing protein [Inediibacterium massiliense]|uniref:SpoIID/LytB domain-containing protein n=1 Tax=Inediibacterium massiliense TaxID=1658111 RepID=UPI0006B47B1E|nr:SpoIID/LytB domain-containing protein [Inediibacterium massiliense]